jgi:hypothetical protein
MAFAFSPPVARAPPVPRGDDGSCGRWRVAALVAFAISPAGAQGLGPAVDVKPGQEVTIPVTVVDGAPKLGPARFSKPSPVEPKEGEILVSVVRHGLSPYAELTASENTPAPVDFVATGLIGNIKIDEIRVCGRLSVGRIASGSWRVSLNSFTVRAAGQDCRP